MEKHRLLAMTDGVVAIIITIMGEARPAKPVKSVRWTDLSVERRELGRAAGGGA